MVPMRRSHSISLNRVSEVIHKFEVIQLPSPPPFLIGAINLRGQIVSVFDLSKAFSGKATEYKSLATCLVIIHINQTKFAIIVDRASGVTHFGDNQCEKIDENLCKKYQEVVTHLHKHGKDIVLKFNTDKLLDFLGYQNAA